MLSLVPPIDVVALPDLPVRVLHRTEPSDRVGLRHGGWFVVRPGTGEVELRDADGELMGAWPVPRDLLDAAATSTFAVDDDGRLLVVSQAAQTVIVDADGRAVRLRARVSNPDGTLSLGLFARIRIVTEERPQAVLVPEASVTATEGRVRASH